MASARARGTRSPILKTFAVVGFALVVAAFQFDCSNNPGTCYRTSPEMCSNSIEGACNGPGLRFEAGKRCEAPWKQCPDIGNSYFLRCPGE